MIQNKNLAHVNAVFPSDQIITTLYTGLPAAIIGILLFFSNTATGEYSIICAPLTKTVNVRADFRFIASLCWGQMTDYTVDETGDFVPNGETGLFFNQYFPYCLFLLSFGGIILKYLFVAFSGRIGKEVEYVIHGIEEASSHLIKQLKPDDTAKDDKNSIKKIEELDIETAFDGSTVDSVRWSTGDKTDFLMFEQYLNIRKQRHTIIKQIVATRLGVAAIMSGVAYLLYKYYIDDTYSPDGRNLSLAYQCKLPEQYWEVFNETNFTKKTVDCYFKGRPTNKLFTWILMIGYLALTFAMVISIFIDSMMWQKAGQILVHFPFEIGKGSSVSDLDVIMTFVKHQPKPATLSVFRMMSGLTREEEKLFIAYFREFLLWLSTDEGNLILKLKTDSIIKVFRS